jgi:hypothetical protein
MNIGLIDVDSRNFPNLALMKISSYYKGKGDSVSFYNEKEKYDIIYSSKIFTDSAEKISDKNADRVIKGGSGYGLKVKLPDEIDCVFPDYTLYNISDKAYGYLTRGFPRGCPFCIVSEKEGGKSRQAYTLDQFWSGQKTIVLLDPNITAAENKLELFNQLAETKSYIDFTQGLDLRLLTLEDMEAIKRLKLRMIHFAWDNIKDEKIIVGKLKEFISATGISRGKLVVYVLVNFNSTFEEDLYRVYKLRELGAAPYVMVYDKANADKIYIKLKNYVNYRPLFYSVERFEDFQYGKAV